MTIDEAIKNHIEFANQMKETSVKEKNRPAVARCYVGMYEDNMQVAEWLTQLKELKESYESDYNIQDVIETCVKFWG